MTTTSASRSAPRPLIELSRRQWRTLIKELRRRGERRRESGAFLLGRRDGDRRVVHIEYFDDLDPGCLRGHIHIDGRAFSKLWDLCESEDLSVLADVHTHPGRSVGQSSIDRENPMISCPGHVALIVPHLAARRVRPRDVGVHEFDGDDGWRSSFGRDAAARVSVRRIL